MRIPEIQERLIDLSTEHNIPELLDLAKELRRRGGERGRTTSLAMTEEIRSSIWWLRRHHPSLSQAEIARKCNVNSGRVSEVLKGKRT